MPQPRVVVFGYGPLALACLDTLEALGVSPVAVVVPGNRRGAVIDEVAAAVTARGGALLVQPPRQSAAPFVSALQALQPDLLLVWSYTMLLPGGVLAIPRLGAVNVHGGLLPEYRGGHVMNWAIANGERETGVTLAFIDEGIDTGPVIAERRFPITPVDDAASVRDKLRTAGESLLTEWWPALASGQAPRQVQDESRARYYRMRSADDGRIDWSLDNTRINDLARALVAPWPGAFAVVAGRKIVVRRAEPVPAAATPAAPGTIRRADEVELRVATGHGDLVLRDVEIDGQRATAQTLHEAGFRPGVRLV